MHFRLLVPVPLMMMIMFIENWSFYHIIASLIQIELISYIIIHDDHQSDGLYIRATDSVILAYCRYLAVFRTVIIITN